MGYWKWYWKKNKDAIIFTTLSVIFVILLPIGLAVLLIYNVGLALMISIVGLFLIFSIFFFDSYEKYKKELKKRT